MESIIRIHRDQYKYSICARYRLVSIAGKLQSFGGPKITGDNGRFPLEVATIAHRRLSRIRSDGPAHHNRDTEGTVQGVTRDTSVGLVPDDALPYICATDDPGILLQRSRMKQTEKDEPRSGRTTTKSVPMELEKPTGPVVQLEGSSGSGVQRNSASSIGATRFADEKLPEIPDVEMGAEEAREAQIKRAKTIMGLEMCVLEAQVDVCDETLATPTHLAETSGENETDEDIVAPEVTEELNRLETLGRIYRAPSAN